MSTSAAAFVVSAVLVVNAIFFSVLRGPTRRARKVLWQLANYKKFLSEVDADAISRANSTGRAPVEMTAKEAFAIALHLDLGWGEHFVNSIGNVAIYAGICDESGDEEDPLFSRGLL